jgi:hypothetical protein
MNMACSMNNKLTGPLAASNWISSYPSCLALPCQCQIQIQMSIYALGLISVSRCSHDCLLVCPYMPLYCIVVLYLASTTTYLAGSR